MNETAEQSDLVISGGGFVGLTLALALSRAFNGEMRVTVVDTGALDPALALAVDARASAIGAGSRRMLQQLDVWELIARDVQAVTAVDLTDSSLSDGVRPVLLSYETGLEDGTAGMSIVANSVLLKALQRSAHNAPGVTLVAKTGVVSAAAARDVTHVTMTNQQIIRAPLVVAADGRKSALREAAGIKSVGWHYPQTGIVTLIAFDSAHHGRAVQHFLPSGPFAILPMPGQRACITWTEATNEAQRLMASDDATFAAAVEQRAGGKWGRIRVDGPRQSWPLEVSLARALVAARLVLVGDAARVVHPLAGQGLNLGLRDVAALAEVIADAARTGQDIGSAPILDGYQRWRRSDGAMSAAAFDALNRLFSNDLALLRTARSAGLGLVDRLPTVKNYLVGEASGTAGTVPRLMRGVAL